MEWNHVNPFVFSGEVCFIMRGAVCTELMAKKKFFWWSVGGNDLGDGRENEKEGADVLLLVVWRCLVLCVGAKKA